MKYLIWLLLFIPALVIELMCYVLNPIAALFVTKRDREDRVKRLGNDVITMEHEYLCKYVYWFQTHDNAADEYWYGLFNEDSWFPYIRNMTQERYDSSWFARYAMRVMWLYRNTAYGFLYALFSKPSRVGDFYTRHTGGIKKVTRFWWTLEIYDKSGFQFECHLPLLPIIGGVNIYNNINIGWKAHRSAERCLYANRVIGIRIRRS